ncbi:MAG: AAA family ATPase [Deltaproteobacteria bacterium]|nr:AAA family ATPase [Deltaproteobacteria bacterium]
MSETGIKVAIGGKGGVGKTTVAALIARLLAKAGKRVIAVDADPVANLAAALGISEDPPITPISELRQLIAERTGAKPGTYGGFFSLTPRVDDLPDRFSRERDGVRLLVSGTLKEGGTGCMCPESAVLRALMQHLILYRDDALVMDMEAGVEHIGRATTRAMDRLIVVVDPGARSHAAARKIRTLAADIGLAKVSVVLNRVLNAADEDTARKALGDFDILGAIPFDDRVAAADRGGKRPFDDLSEAPPQFETIVGALLSPAP